MPTSTTAVRPCSRSPDCIIVHSVALSPKSVRSLVWFPSWISSSPPSNQSFPTVHRSPLKVVCLAFICLPSNRACISCLQSYSTYVLSSNLHSSPRREPYQLARVKPKKIVDSQNLGEPNVSAGGQKYHLACNVGSTHMDRSTAYADRATVEDFASGQPGVISYDGTIRCTSTEVSRKGIANVMTIDVVAKQNVAEKKRHH